MLTERSTFQEWFDWIAKMYIICSSWRKRPCFDAYEQSPDQRYQGVCCLNAASMDIRTENDFIILWALDQEHRSLNLSRGTAIPVRLQVRPARTQISLRVRAVWSESSQGTLWEPRIQSVFRRTTKTLIRLAHAQADLRLRWALMQYCRECCVPAQLWYKGHLTTLQCI